MEDLREESVSNLYEWAETARLESEVVYRDMDEDEMWI